GRRSPTARCRASGSPVSRTGPRPPRPSTRQPTPPSGSARRGGRGRSSLALELRLALLQERADALARILAAEHGGERLLLGGNAVVEVALVRRALDVLQRER